MKKILVGLFLLVVLAVVAFSLVRGYRAYHKIRSVAKVSPSVGKSIGILLKSFGVKGDTWELEAERASMKGSKVFLDRVKLWVRGEKRVEVVAERGRYDRNKRVGELTGNVVVKGRDFKITGDRMVWNQKKGEICMVGPFVYKGKYLMKGRDLCYYPSLDKVVVKALGKVVIR